MPAIVVRVRAIIIHHGQLLMCRQNHPGQMFYNLPGGHLEPGETIQAGMERELIEETHVKPALGPLLFVNQFIDGSNHSVEFFFSVANTADYRNLDLSRASHAYELESLVFGDPTDPKFDIKPSFLKKRFAELVAQGNRFQTEITVSH